MKKMLLIFLVAAIPSFAQTNKGKISLIYNDEKFDLPVTQILIRKENNILISLRAEKNDSSGLQTISLEFPLDNLSDNSRITHDDFRLSISSQDRNNPRGKRFTFNYGPKEAAIEMYYGNERLNWSSPSFQFKFDRVDITQSENGLKISGSFSGKYNSGQSVNSLKTVAEIKEGKFELIL